MAQDLGFIVGGHAAFLFVFIEVAMMKRLFRTKAKRIAERFVSLSLVEFGFRTNAHFFIFSRRTF